jgi:hypothetical protein
MRLHDEGDLNHSKPYEALSPKQGNMMSEKHRRATCVSLMLITIPLGLAWRMVPLGLSHFFYKYGGSALWAVALYWFIAACLPKLRVGTVASIAAGTAAALEFSRLWHAPAMDAFRVTLAGRLLLGRYFSVRNIVAYWLAIVLTALLDHLLLRRSVAQSQSR